MQRMLIVDDEESICFSMKEYFSMQGFHVDCALDRGEAEAFLAGSGYAVVIDDLRLGGMSKHRRAGRHRARHPASPVHAHRRAHGVRVFRDGDRSEEPRGGRVSSQAEATVGRGSGRLRPRRNN